MKNYHNNILAFFLISGLGACSSVGVEGLGQSVTVTHSYSSQTTVASSAPTQMVQDQPQRFQIRLAVKNSTPFPIKIFFNPSLTANQYAARTVYTFPVSPMGFLVPQPDLYLEPGEIRIFSSTKVGKPSDAFRLCWKTANPMETYGVCTPTDIFLGRFPAAPLRMLLTIRGDQPDFSGSDLSLANVVQPHRKIPTVTVGRYGDRKHEYTPPETGPISHAGVFIP